MAPFLVDSLLVCIEEFVGKKQGEGFLIYYSYKQKIIVMTEFYYIHQDKDESEVSIFLLVKGEEKKAFVKFGPTKEFYSISIEEAEGFALKEIPLRDKKNFRNFFDGINSKALPNEDVKEFLEKNPPIGVEDSEQEKYAYAFFSPVTEEGSGKMVGKQFICVLSSNGKKVGIVSCHRDGRYHQVPPERLSFDGSDKIALLDYYSFNLLFEEAKKDNIQKSTPEAFVKKNDISTKVKP